MGFNYTMALLNSTFTTPNYSTIESNCGFDSQEVSNVKLTALIALVVAAFTGNVLVCWIVYKNNNLRNTLNYLLVNMAVSDLVIPLLAAPTRIIEISTHNNEWRVKGQLGELLCKLIFFVLDVSPVVSILSLLLITFDRFVAVVFPFKATKISSKFRKYSIALTWVIAMAFCSPYLYAIKLDDNNQQCVMDWEPAFDPVTARGIHAIMLLVVFIAIPFTLLLVMYSMILYKMKTRPKNLSQTEKGRRRRHLSERNIVLLSFAVVLIFALCWGPYLTMLMLANFKWNWDFTRVSCNWDDILFVVQYLAFSNAAINPFLYFIFLKNYRKGLKTLTYGTCFHDNVKVKSARSLISRNASAKESGALTLEMHTKI